MQDVEARVFKISSVEELTKLLSEAKSKNLAILPGRAGKLPNAAFIDLSMMDKVLEHCLDDQVIKVETGISVNKLNEYLEGSKQWFPVSAVNDSVTVFDVINAGEGGPLDHQFGGPRQLVLGLEVVLASGEITKCGGRVVKNVTGYDLVKLFIGSQASFGIAVNAYLRLYAKPETEKTIYWLSNDAKVLVDLARNLTGSGLPLSCLELIDSHLLYDIAGEPKDVESLGCVLHQRQAMLLAQVNGHATEVDELVFEGLAIGNQLKMTGKVLESQIAQSLWTKLSGVDAVLGHTLAIAATWTQISKIVEKWRSEHKFVLWQARPNMSLVKIFAQDMPTILELKDSLKDFFKRHNEVLTMAYSADEFERTIEYLGQDAGVNTELKKQLKEKFDPYGLLNPGISF